MNYLSTYLYIGGSVTMSTSTVAEASTTLQISFAPQSMITGGPSGIIYYFQFPKTTATSCNSCSVILYNFYMILQIGK